MDRFRLRDEIEDRIQGHRPREREDAFKNWLLPDSALTVSDQRALRESRSRGRSLFVMPTAGDLGVVDAKIGA